MACRCQPVAAAKPLDDFVRHVDPPCEKERFQIQHIDRLPVQVKHVCEQSGLVLAPPPPNGWCIHKLSKA